MSKKFFESGFEIYKGKSAINGDEIVAILTLKSVNRKTGNMAQLWILSATYPPLDAMNSGKDEAICGDCKLRQHKGGACYVYIGQEPLTIYKAWQEGAYPKLKREFYYNLEGLSIRFGAYGDPFAIPVEILNDLKAVAKNYTGYTHQWSKEGAANLKSLCMASVDNEAEYHQAVAAGWRTFRIIHQNDPIMENEILCPNITSNVQCLDCNLCTGNSKQAKNIAVHVHGSNKSKFGTTQSEIEGLAIDENGEIQLITRNSKTELIEDANNNTKRKPSRRIINSLELQWMVFDTLELRDRWGQLFGAPSHNFHCIIHGMSGHGKSTFAIQFANYLAENFGRVIYVSGEEGIGMTLNSKFSNHNAYSLNIDLADLRNYNDIFREITPGSYEFIFIDSLDTMKITPAILRKIKEFYKKSALITISQSTKKGQIRGSNELVHDSDIVVKVEDGLATSIKNRFKETGLSFDVFRNNSDNTNDGESKPFIGPDI